MGDTKIAWADKTWNPLRARNKVTGKVGWFCEHVSEGCRNCYAEKMNINTYFGNGLEYKLGNMDHLELFLDEKILEQPLHWRKPVKVFPCSMTDLFGRWVKDEWLDRIFAVMGLAKQHTFQCLTKRTDRMLEYMTRLSRSVAPLESAARQMGHTFKFRSPLDGKEYGLLPWPIPNVWAGTSCEDQETADERLPLLLQTPAAVRWMSAEPLFGPIDLTRSIGTYDCMNCGYRGFECDNAAKVEQVDGDLKCPECGAVLEFGMAENSPNMTSLDWVVVGGESGPKARPMHPDWARSLRDQCVAAGVPFFFKQWGEYRPANSIGEATNYPTLVAGPDNRVTPASNCYHLDHQVSAYIDGSGELSKAQCAVVKLGKKAAGRLLDGREWNEFPAAA